MLLICLWQAADAICQAVNPSILQLLPLPAKGVDICLPIEGLVWGIPALLSPQLLQQFIKFVFANRHLHRAYDSDSGMALSCTVLFGTRCNRSLSR